MRHRQESCTGLPLLAAALLIPIVLACGGGDDGTGAGEEPASRRVRPEAAPDTPAPAPVPDQPGLSPGPGAEAPAQPKLAKPTRPTPPKPPAPVRPPFRTKSPEEARVAQLVPGAPMPAAFPRDLPVPSGAQQVAAFDGGPERSTVAYETGSDVQQVIGELERGYLDAGFEVQTASGSGQALVWARKPGHVVMAALTPADGGGTRIEVSSLTGDSAR